MCDCEYPDFYNEVKRKARKQHRCCGQWCEIKPGDEYIACSGKWNGDVSTYKLCLECSKLHRWIEKTIDCCVALQDLRSELHDSDLVHNEDLEDGTEIEVSGCDEIEMVDGKWRLKEIATVQS